MVSMHMSTCTNLSGANRSFAPHSGVCAGMHVGTRARTSLVTNRPLVPLLGRPLRTCHTSATACESTGTYYSDPPTRVRTITTASTNTCMMVRTSGCVRANIRSRTRTNTHVLLARVRVIISTHTHSYLHEHLDEHAHRSTGASTRIGGCYLYWYSCWSGCLRFARHSNCNGTRTRTNNTNTHDQIHDMSNWGVLNGRNATASPKSGVLLPVCLRVRLPTQRLALALIQCSHRCSH